MVSASDSLFGEMTIIRAVPGRNQKLWIAVSLLVSTVLVIMGEDILKV